MVFYLGFKKNIELTFLFNDNDNEATHDTEDEYSHDNIIAL